jgi:hypothetical protein
MINEIDNAIQCQWNNVQHDKKKNINICIHICRSRLRENKQHYNNGIQCRTNSQ